MSEMQNSCRGSSADQMAIEMGHLVRLHPYHCQRKSVVQTWDKLEELSDVNGEDNDGSDEPLDILLSLLYFCAYLPGDSVSNYHNLENKNKVRLCLFVLTAFLTLRVPCI